MKKFIRENKRWLVAGAGLLLLVLMAASTKLIPGTIAKYASDTKLVETGISGVSNDDLETMLQYMMNERYPDGSIYMTADPAMDTAAKIDAAFGGTWEAFGEKRVPVGIAPLGSFDDFFIPVNRQGGRTPGGGGLNNATFSIFGRIIGNPSLTPGGVSWTPATTPVTASAGTVTVAKNATHPSTTTDPSTNALVGATNYPTDLINSAGAILASLTTDNYASHYHNVTVSGAQTHNGGAGSRQCSSVCPNNGGKFNVSSKGVSDNTTYTLTLNNTGTNSFFHPANIARTATPLSLVSRTLGTDITSSLVYYNNPVINISNPTWTYTQQAMNPVDLPFSYTGAGVVDDLTLQPYVIVYMYIRRAPATLPPLP